MAGDFLPPDPHAPAPPARRPPAARPTFLPPNAEPVASARRRDDRAFIGLVLGSGALGVLVITLGGLGFLTLPFSVAAWVLGAKARRRAPDHPHARVAMLLGVVGTVLALVATGVYAAVSPVD